MGDVVIDYARPPLAARERAVGYIPELDTFRTVAILLVMSLHWLPERSWINRIQTGGDFGVYLFFVLSGFLITRILMRCREDAERGISSRGFALRQFYARRFLRIFPAYYLLLLVGVALNSPGLRAGFAWHAAYLSNVYFYHRRAFGGPASLFWTLSVEEQFYLLWPLAILFIPRRAIQPFVVATLVLGTILHGAARLMHPWAGILTPACMNFLAAGALIAVCESNLCGGAAKRERLLRLFAVLSGALALAAIVLWFVPSVPKKLDWERVVIQTGASFAFAWSIARAADGVGGALGIVLRFAPLVYLGRISYGLYIYQQFVVHWLNWLPPRVARHAGGGSAITAFASTFTARFLATVALASLSWFLYEKPLNDLKRFFPYARKPRPLALEERGVPLPAATGS
ncbi:MAG TPA: acyltransferase [Tepidisphaeraceae bacterium]|nr:acyltransferase [Tepidisphaeraceae bacterium]